MPTDKSSIPCDLPGQIDRIDINILIAKLAPRQLYKQKARDIYDTESSITFISRTPEIDSVVKDILDHRLGLTWFTRKEKYVVSRNPALSYEGYRSVCLVRPR